MNYYMKQTIEIEVPDGKKAVWKDNKVVFEDIKPQLPKTWEEFCENKPISYWETYIDNRSFISLIGNRERDNSRDKNALPNNNAAEQHLALMQLHQLRDCYRQGWVPDWNESNTVKHYIGHDNAESYCVYISFITPTFLSFQSKELAKEFLNNFRELIEQAGDLI